MKLNTNSNTYTIIYASVLVIVVAFLLAFVYQALKPTQDRNVELDTKIHKLNALNQRNLDKNDVEALFAKLFIESVTQSGVEYEVYDVQGARKYLVTVRGQGLWGPIFGYIAVDADRQTIFGADFQHESETAGLGALITERWFQEEFCGKKIFATDGSDVAITVCKKGNHGALADENVVDGITGATLTSNGVDAMIKDGLTKWIATQHEK